MRDSWSRRVRRRSFGADWMFNMAEQDIAQILMVNVSVETASIFSWVMRIILFENGMLAF